MFLDPTILFFILGVSAGLLRSNLDIPPAVSRFISLYLLMALGLKGGFALAESGIDQTILLSLMGAVAMAFAVPLLGYPVLKRITNKFDAAAIAAAFGSVSAVTFITATQVADSQGLAPAGHMAVALVLMETPAIIVALVMASYLRQQTGINIVNTSVVNSNMAGSSAIIAATGPAGAASLPTPTAPFKLGHLIKDSLTDGSQMVLIGALIIGLITGEQGQSVMQPFAGDIFKGMLAFFLLDMGLAVAKQLRGNPRMPALLVVYALAAPLVHGGLAWLLAGALQLPATDTFLLMVLSASASYIVVPAVLRDAMPEANPAHYLGLSLAITFPFNVLLGIPLYLQWAML